MSEPTSSAVPDQFVDGSEKALTPEKIETILGDFREWLQRLPKTQQAAVSPPSPTASMDLSTLLREFIAVKQEVHLQTKSVRAQQEQNSAMLEHLSEALGHLQKREAEAQDREQAIVEQSTLPVLKTLMELYDALSLGQKEAERVAEEVLPLVREWSSAGPELDLPPIPQGGFGLLSRIFGNQREKKIQQWLEATQDQLRALGELREDQKEAIETGRERIEKMLSSLITGYQMGLQRIERALAKHELEAIPTVGERFDPELMEVVEVVTSSNRPTGEVVEEVRRGFQRNGQPVRFAQVRVSRPLQVVEGEQG